MEDHKKRKKKKKKEGGFNGKQSPATTHQGREYFLFKRWSRLILYHVVSPK